MGFNFYTIKGIEPGIVKDLRKETNGEMKFFKERKTRYYSICMPLTRSLAIQVRFAIFWYNILHKHKIKMKRIKIESLL